MANAITIDGPAGAGKTTMAKRLAQNLDDYIYVDTGAFYRALAVYKREHPGVMFRSLSAKHIDGKQTMYVNDVCIDEDKLRTQETSEGASKISVDAGIRHFVNEAIRAYAADKNVIMEGRDTGTVIMPDAMIKFYLDADITNRAQRRVREYNILKSGLNEMINDIQKRDERDMTRENDPLKIAPGAIYIDTTHLNIKQVSKFMKDIVTHFVADQKN